MTTQSNDLKKHFMFKRLTRDLNGHIKDLPYFAAWCYKYQYELDCKRWEIVDVDGSRTVLKNLIEVIAYLDENIVTKRTKNGFIKGGLPIVWFHVMYYSEKSKTDRTKVVELVLVGAEEHVSYSERFFGKGPKAKKAKTKTKK
jgi:hypothetical protein